METHKIGERKTLKYYKKKVYTLNSLLVTVANLGTIKFSPSSVFTELPQCRWFTATAAKKKMNCF